MTKRIENEIEEEEISTHTSLAGRDDSAEFLDIIRVISTHTSLAGRDNAASMALSFFVSFLLTRPSRDVTIC